MTLNFTHSERQHYKALRQELIDTHLYVRGTTNRAADTAELLIDKVGLENANQIVALMVNCKGDWDKRISRTNRVWADETEPLADDITIGCLLFYCDEIHPSHMDMIADYLRRR